MTTGQGQFGANAQGVSPRSSFTSASVTASSARPAGLAANEEATVTAELPAVAGRAKTASSYGPSRHRPGHRDPAPVLLQFAVILLALALVIVLAGLIVEKERPAWLSFLRNTAPVAAAPGTPAPAGTQRITSGLKRVSVGATSATYEVPSSSYQLLVTTGGADCYVEIKSPPGESGYFYAHTLPPSTRAAKIAVHGTIAVTLEASATSIGIADGSHTIGTIKKPIPTTFTYIFQPATH